MNKEKQTNLTLLTHLVTQRYFFSMFCQVEMQVIFPLCVRIPLGALSFSVGENAYVFNLNRQSTVTQSYQVTYTYVSEV